VVWNVRNCLADRAGAKRLTDLVIRVNATFSAAPAAIIYCAQAAMEQHTRLGFSRDHGVVIGNGYDFSVFAPSAERAREFRRELGVGETTRIVGTIGRFHPWKNHPLFLSVASGVAARFSEVVFVMIGRGVDLANVALTEQIRELGLEGRVFLLGERGDVPKLLPAFDLYCSTSTNEGFPNVIAEAMAAGAPGVVTDVGASRELVEGIGAVVPSGDREGIVAGLCDLLSLPEGEFAERRKAARERMISRHSLPQVVERYQWLYTSLVAPVA
jgi:glycosyltransferase involved in cell wall biosynthesis